MEITEVRVRVVRDGGKKKLRAFASLTFDNSFVVREVKIIEGDNGLFVAMPSRKVTERCRECGCRNVVQSNFCNGCGKKLHSNRDFSGQHEKMYMDVAYPINSECRQMIHDFVISEYDQERQRQQLKEKIDQNNRRDSSNFDNVEVIEEHNEGYVEEPEEETVEASDNDSFSQGIFG
jgi:stage V sporulation protein G